jgi:hypothetical protein
MDWVSPRDGWFLWRNCSETPEAKFSLKEWIRPLSCYIYALDWCLSKQRDPYTVPV